MGWRLCIELLLGSSRIILLTMIVSSLDWRVRLEFFCRQLVVDTHLLLNHPFFPRLQFAVCVGPGGIMINAAKPNTNVKRPYPKLQFPSRIILLFAHLDHKQPPPASVAILSAQVKESKP